MNTRHGNLRAAAALALLAALGFWAPPAGIKPAREPGTQQPPSASSPVARGMLIPARIRLMVRFNPSRTA